MNLYSMFGTDTELETSGVWLDFGGPRIRVARAGGANSRFTALMAEKARQYNPQIKAEVLPENIGRKLMIEVYAEAVILDWEGMSDRDGNSLAFNRSNVIQVMTDLPDLFNLVQEHAAKMANFKRAQLEVEAGNSQPA